MDFEKILHVARKNELNKKEPVKCLQTKFKPPTKEQREKDKVLSEGVQRFLARKEEEEKQKQKEAERRKQELLALRAKDPKANRRIQTMLKRTKSANKSVMEDAIDNNNTADTLAGPSQPDEDDYGFVSETSSQLYNKLIQKMYSMPSDDQPKFAPAKKPNGHNLLNTKERVKMALLKQEEEEKLPNKRKRRGKDKRDDDDDDDDSQLDYSGPERDLNNLSSGKDKTDPPKPKKPAPPPMDFQELLKIAEQKQHEPIVFQPKEKKSEEPEVLMTKKQKMEYERMQEWKRKRELGLLNMENRVLKEEKKKITNGKQPLSNTKIPKIDNQDNQRPPEKTKDVKMISGREKNRPKPQVAERLPKSDDKKTRADDETSRLIKERDEALRILKEKERLIKERDEAMRRLKEKEQIIRERDEAMRRLKEKEQIIRERDEALRKLKMLDKTERMGKIPGKSAGPLAEKQTKPSVKLDGKVSAINKPNGIVSKVNGKDVRIPQKSLPPKDGKDGKVREFPPRDLKPVKRFPPDDVRRKPQPMKRRRIDSDEDEYDSELDDFIDDGEDEVCSEDVSKVISEVFRYNKNRYSRYDEDEECMESDYHQISKEEFFSTKCGILEDLQDIQREKAALAKKKKQKR